MKGGLLRKKKAAGALDELMVLGSHEECLQSLGQLTTLSDLEKAGIREISIRCWKVIQAARYKMVGGAEVHTLMADTMEKDLG